MVNVFLYCMLRANSVSHTLEKGPANLQSPLNPKAVETSKVSKDVILQSHTLTTLSNTFTDTDIH